MAGVAFRITLLPVFAGLASLGGCSSDRADTPWQADDGTGASPAIAAALPVPRDPAVDRTAPVPLALDGDGLILRAVGKPSIAIPFGARQADVERTVAAASGPLTRGSMNECGAGPMQFVRSGSLQMNMMRGRFVGWLVQDSGFVTVDGVQVGSGRKRLELERGVRILEDSTLDGEFDYLTPAGKKIGGFFSDDGPEAEVTGLYAGTNCFFR